MNRKTSVKIELHCHSNLSDGSLSPEDIAVQLAIHGIAYASLTDHNTIAGLKRFRYAAEKHGITVITGIELSTKFENRELHLLSYGFSADSIELDKLIGKMAAVKENEEFRYVPDAESAIALLHEAGGLVVLAHPSVTEPDHDKLVMLLTKLKKIGLDGIESIYSPLPIEEHNRLIDIARDFDLVSTGGSDSHFNNMSSPPPGITISTSQWKSIRNAILDINRRITVKRGMEKVKPRDKKGQIGVIKYFLYRIALPAILSLALFVALLFWVILPTFENALMDRKREMIKELTKAASGVLQEAYNEVIDGRASLLDAQRKALDAISVMRYGKEEKDYFWVQDLSPAMLMHPYRKELNGTDLSQFRDTRGILIFNMFAALAKTKREGYVNYVWQWKDNKRRMEPKESYIRLFEPWGWVIGTGVYIYDIKEEIERIERNMVRASLAISIAVILLILYLLQQNLKLENDRIIAERRYRESSERYKILVEAASEGALMAVKGRCRYANPVLLDMLGYIQNDIELLTTDDIFADDPYSALQKDIAGVVKLKTRSGATVECRATVKEVETGNSEKGIIVLLRPLRSETGHDSVDVLGCDSITVFLADISNGLTETDVVDSVTRSRSALLSMVSSHIYSPTIAAAVSKIVDAATTRFIELAIQEMGQPPCTFAFVALGSQGREEQSLFTDQDNCLIIDDQNNGTQGEHYAAYFLQLAQKVCSNLAQCGFKECLGGIMANKAKWNQPLAVWKGYFSDWINRAEPQELLEFSLFFDFRTVYGENSLGNMLRQHVFTAAKNSPRFYSVSAISALDFKPPIAIIGTFQGEIDIKQAMMPIVAYARLYSLAHEIWETNTVKRIEELVKKGILLASRGSEINRIYEIMLSLRFVNQVQLIQKRVEIDNLIELSSLGRVDEAILKICFKEITQLQNDIKRDFIGGGEGVA